VDWGPRTGGGELAEWRPVLTRSARRFVPTPPPHPAQRPHGNDDGSDSEPQQGLSCDEGGGRPLPQQHLMQEILLFRREVGKAYAAKARADEIAAGRGGQVAGAAAAATGPS
jgi:hypothetical protein